MSSFSFMHQEDEPELEQQPEAAAGLSGFNFVNESVSPTEPVHVVESPHALLPAADLALPRTASAKNVKKKKKAARVGFGRDDEDDDHPQHPSPTPVHTPHQQQQQQQHSSEHSSEHEQVEQHDSQLLPASPAPPVPSTPAEEVEEPISSSSFSFLSAAADDHHSSSSTSTSSSSEIVGEAEKEVEEVDSPPPPPPPLPQHEEEREEVHVEVLSVTADEVVFEGVDEEVLRELIQLRRAFGEVDVAGIAAALSSASASASALQAAATELRSVEQTQQTALQALSSSHSSVTDLKARIRELEQQQAALARAERFEQADLLTAQLTATQAGLLQQTHSCEVYLQQLGELSGAVRRARGRLLQQMRDYGAGGSTSQGAHPQALAKAQLAVARDLLAKALAEEEKRSSAALRRIEMEQAHYLREQAALEAEAAIVDDAIKLEVGDQLDRKQQMELELTGVQGEIRMLEEQLAARKRDETRLLRSLATEDSKICEARGKYDRQLQRIEDRRGDLLTALRECNAELRAAADRKAEAEGRLTHSTDTVNGIELHLLRSSEEVQAAQRVADDLANLLGNAKEVEEVEKLRSAHLAIRFDREDLLRDLADAEFLQMRAAVVQLTCSSEEVASEAEEVSSAFGSAKAELASNAEATAKLEAEKKVLAANKRFKEAAAAAKDLKDLAARRELLEAEAAGRLQQMVAVEARRAEVAQQLQQVEGNMREHEARLYASLHLRVDNRMRDLLRRRRRMREEVQKSTGGGSSASSLVLGAAEDIYEQDLSEMRDLRNTLLLKHPLPAGISQLIEEDGEGGDEAGAVTIVEVAEVIELEEQVQDERDEVGTHDNDDPVDEVADEIVPCILEEDVVEDAEALAQQAADLAAAADALDADIEAAVESEDYDRASELQEAADATRAQLLHLHERIKGILQV